MADADWNDPSRRALGMLLDGDAILESDPHGRRIVGDTLLVLFNTGTRRYIRAGSPARSRVDSGIRYIDQSIGTLFRASIVGGQDEREIGEVVPAPQLCSQAVKIRAPAKV